MGKGKRKTGGKPKTKASQKPLTTAPAPQQQYTAEEYLGKADEYMNSLQHDMAVMFLRKALEVDPNCVEALDMLGEVLTETGHAEEALKVLTHSVSLNPNQGYSKYMYLGQLTLFPESVAYIQRGMALLEAEKARLASVVPPNEALLSTVRQKISAAYCAIVEIYTTEACFEADAEQQSERAAVAAVAEDEGVESLCALANVRLSQSRPDQAKLCLEKAATILSALTEKVMCEEEGDTGDSAMMDTDTPAVPSGLEGVERWPDFEVRFSLARMLVEVELLEEAYDVLQVLLGEDDENGELWFLQAIVGAAQGDVAGALECLNHALTLAEKQHADEETKGLIQSKIAELSGATGETGDANMDT